ncbi:hypothetical protein FO519_006171 [Halicephalobus sp. NKZ332]|nr:hypothetical protein FO519_006171 [Halicephalobus sp. NKZ332]
MRFTFADENILLRIINGAGSHMLMLMIEGHRFSIVSADGYPLKPVETDMMIILPGERYDVLVSGLGNPEKSSYWIQLETLEHYNKTGGKIEPFFGAAKLFYEEYQGRIQHEKLYNCPFKQFPKGYNYSCRYATDLEAVENLVDEEITSSNGFDENYEEHFINIHYDSHMNGWMYQHPRGIPYFHKENLDSVAKVCNRSACPADTDNRDTVQVPMGGYIVIRFRADNPGWWYSHCHLMLHQMAGMAFAMKFGEHEQMPIPPINFPHDCGDYEAPPLDPKLKERFTNVV